MLLTGSLHDVPLPAVGDCVAPDQVCRDFLSIVEKVSYIDDVIRVFQNVGGVADVRMDTERRQLDGHHGVATRFQVARCPAHERR